MKLVVAFSSKEHIPAASSGGFEQPPLLHGGPALRRGAGICRGRTLHLTFHSTPLEKELRRADLTPLRLRPSTHDSWSLTNRF